MLFFATANKGKSYLGMYARGCVHVICLENAQLTQNAQPFVFIIRQKMREIISMCRRLTISVIFVPMERLIVPYFVPYSRNNPLQDILEGIIAERTRFELVVRNDPYVGLANRWFQPLTHLSWSIMVVAKSDYKDRENYLLCKMYFPEERKILVLPSSV